MAILSGVVSEDSEGVIVLRSGIRIRVRSNIRPANLAVGAQVVVNARLRDTEWVADDVDVR